MQPSEGADVESEYDDEAMEVDEQGRDDAEPVSPQRQILSMTRRL